MRDVSKMNRRDFLKTFGLTAAAVYGMGFNWGKQATVLIEAEGFRKRGGWVLDQQFMDQMGSPFLLAHGLGKPVADAEATVEFPETGEYRVWVRSRDWVAPWKGPDTPKTKRAKGTPGIFKVKVDGKTLERTFGNEGAKWHWQNGGTVDINNRKVTVALHDLTGFEGRCDAVLFSKDKSLNPPNHGEKMAQFRSKLRNIPEKPIDAGQFDLVVVGGGMAGMCAALKAARLGLSVALIQDRPVVGGNNSSEVRVWLGGETNYEPYPQIGDILREFEPAKRAHYGPSNTAELYEDEKRISILESEKNIKLFLCHRANRIEVDDGLIVAVIAEHTATRQHYRFKGSYFADCTGDGCIGFLAGAHHDILLDGHMGRCNLWNAKDTGQNTPFPQCPWALDLGNKPFPSELDQLGVWYWESGFYHDPIKKSEYIRDWNFRAMYGAWDALKNVKGLYSNYKLNWAAYISGKRESRRLLGDVILTQKDIVEKAEFSDACVPCSWPMDLHLPDPKYDDGWEGDEFISKAHYTRYQPPYWLPYRCLYSRNVNNLFMAGRDISVTHEALGAVRVMRTCGMMGEIVGMAASICRKHNILPRAVYTDHLAELKKLMKQDRSVRDISEVTPDLVVPAMEDRAPSAGRRVKQVLNKYHGTKVYHCLYLPTDWKRSGKYPLIVEYAGNGPYRNSYGDKCSGRAEDCSLGYGISGGEKFIWVCLPYISIDGSQNQLQWWGDVPATVDYCKQVVSMLCAEYGADESRVILTGFSRGAIACNYIGLHDDEITKIWAGFIAHSHYDGVKQWNYKGSDRASARKRLKRLGKRMQFISCEGSVEETRRYLEDAKAEGDFTFVSIPFRNHTDTWALRDIAERKKLRRWIKKVIDPDFPYKVVQKK